VAGERLPPGKSESQTTRRWGIEAGQVPQAQRDWRDPLPIYEAFEANAGSGNARSGGMPDFSPA